MDESRIRNDFLRWKNKKIIKKGSKFNQSLNWKKTQHKNRKQLESDFIDSLTKEYNEFDCGKTDYFCDFPLTDKTKVGLEDCGYIQPTAIQKASILPALKGNDILGAAKTGSGKTLAFLLPVLECLYRHRYSTLDGPGALIISPTRELALQTFEVLCKIGRKHDFSAGLVIGGKEVKEEAERVSRTNIIICTPGRLLQHLDSTSYFSLENLKMLVLDEADRILDLGFSATLNAIIENLPCERQTLLFSATQTKSIKDLARLSLTNPVYISVHEESKHCTPKGLVQRYVICPIQDKINILYSFVRCRLKTKILVFVSSCKQVQYLFTAFCQLRPGISIMHLHGNMHLGRRLGVYREFCRKQHALLIATDIAARGLDFPDINWVVQLDCPEDADTYVHRVGRTARFHGNGNALLVLLPSEIAMLDDLAAKKVPIEKTSIKLSKLVNVNDRLQSFCAKSQEMQDQAKRCFVAYFKSIHVMKNKSVFKIKEISPENFATSLGLAVTPRVRFLQRLEKRAEQSKKKAKAAELRQKKMEVLKSISQGEHNDNKGDQKILHNDSTSESDLFSIKAVSANDIERKIKAVEAKKEAVIPVKRSKRKKSKISTTLLRKGNQLNLKTRFDDEGNPVLEDDAELPCDDSNGGGLDIEEAKDLMKKRDVDDRKEQRKKLSKRRLAKKLKAKEQKDEEPVEGKFEVQLVSHDDENVPFKRRKISETEESNRIPTNNSSVSLQDSVSMSLKEQEDLVLQLIGK